MRRRSALAAIGAFFLAAAAFLGLACSGSGPSAPSGGGTVYAALGASDAVGVGADPLTDGYVFRVADQIAAVHGGVELRNLGVPGARIDTFENVQLPGAIAADPQVVTVWAGSNDLIAGRSPGEFGSRLAALLGELAAETSAQVYVGDLVDLTTAPRFRSTPDKDVTTGRVRDYNARIASAAAASGAVLVRLSAVPIDDSLYASDGFHPNSAGHERIARAFWQEIGPRL